MARFAHIETGCALDPHENETQAAYLARFAPEITQSWSVAAVPDGTAHGAKNNGDGTFTNPAAPNAPSLEPKVLTATAFMDHCYAQLGGGAVGMARYAQIIRLARAASANSDLIGAAVERYDSARAGGTFAKDQVRGFAAILIGATIMRQDEADAIVNNWPIG